MSSIANLANHPLINSTELDRRVRNVKRGQSHIIKSRKTLNGLDPENVEAVCDELLSLIRGVKEELNPPSKEVFASVFRYVEIDPSGCWSYAEAIVGNPMEGNANRVEIERYQPDPTPEQVHLLLRISSKQDKACSEAAMHDGVNVWACAFIEEEEDGLRKGKDWYQYKAKYDTYWTERRASRAKTRLGV